MLKYGGPERILVETEIGMRTSSIDIDCLGNVDGDDDDDVRYNFPTKNYN